MSTAKFDVLQDQDGVYNKQISVQVADYRTGTYASGTTVMPHDNTIPQITEGDEYLSLAITPKSALNVLKIEVVLPCGQSAANNASVMALFQDSTVNALASMSHFQSVANGSNNLALVYYMVAGTVSSTTFTVRAGTGSTGTFGICGTGGGALLGTSLEASITITEYQPS